MVGLAVVGSGRGRHGVHALRVEAQLPAALHQPAGLGLGGGDRAADDGQDPLPAEQRGRHRPRSRRRRGPGAGRPGRTGPAQFGDGRLLEPGEERHHHLGVRAAGRVPAGPRGAARADDRVDPGGPVGAGEPRGAPAERFRHREPACDDGVDPGRPHPGHHAVVGPGAGDRPPHRVGHPEPVSRPTSPWSTTTATCCPRRGARRPAPGPPTPSRPTPTTPSSPPRSRACSTGSSASGTRPCRSTRCSTSTSRAPRPRACRPTRRANR